MLITVTAPTGAGKSTLAQALVSLGVSLIPTWTTRPLRPGEAERGDMVQVSFSQMQECVMLETAEYDGHWYGTPLLPAVKEALSGASAAVKILEPQGLVMLRDQVTRTFPKAAGGEPPRLGHVYVDVEGETAQRRILARCHGKPSPADQRRMMRALKECATWCNILPWDATIDNNEEANTLLPQASRLIERLGVAQLLGR